MIKNGTYHRQLGPLPGKGLWHGEINLVYSEHAKLAAATDRYGSIPLFGSVEFDWVDVVEVTVEDGEPVKAVLRIPFDEDAPGARDIVYVLTRPAAGSAIVKTMWFNLSRDSHRTLDHTKYVRP